MLGCSEIKVGEGHLYRIPLPLALSASPALKRLVMTLAWLSPINPAHPSYRQSQLWFAKPESPLDFEAVELDFRNSARGTVQHQIYESSSARAFVEGSTIDVTVSCREEAGRLPSPIPYAVAATLEVGEAIPIYQEIRARLRQRIDIVPKAP